MAAVAWDVPKYYPPVEPPPAAWGEVRRPLPGRWKPKGWGSAAPEGPLKPSLRSAVQPL